MKRCLAAFLFALLAACSPASSDVDDEAARQRAELAAATVDARGKLSYFWERFAAPAPGEYDFALKVALPRRDGEAGSEDVWVADVAREADGASGALSVQPRFQPGMKRGDRVMIPEAAIIDWAFFQGDKLIGHYTTRRMLDTLPPEEADMLRALFGDNPE